MPVTLQSSWRSPSPSSTGACRSRFSAPPIGIDFGAAGVRAAQVTGGGTAWTVIGTARAERSPAQDFEDRDRLSALRRCLAQWTFRGRRAVVAVPHEDVEFHALELPKSFAEVGQKQAVQAVELEVTRLMTFPEGTVEARHWVLPPGGNTAPSAIGVAARRNAVLALLDTCDEAGLFCQSVDTAACALCRFGLALHLNDPETIWGVLDLGMQEARLVLCKGEVPVLVRAVGGGGAAYTTLIAETLKISPQSAEVHKRDHGIALTQRGVRHDDPSSRDIQREAEKDRASDGQLASMILGVLRSDLNRLANEVKRSYEYALTCYPENRAGQLVLVGGGARMRNLPQFLGKALGIVVRPAGAVLGDDACRLQGGQSLRNTVEELASAIGLAMGAAG
jgi:type IV pilus assembly protein PilM